MQEPLEARICTHLRCTTARSGSPSRLAGLLIKGGGSQAELFVDASPGGPGCWVPGLWSQREWGCRGRGAGGCPASAAPRNQPPARPAPPSPPAPPPRPQKPTLLLLNGALLGCILILLSLLFVTAGAARWDLLPHLAVLLFFALGLVVSVNWWVEPLGKSLPMRLRLRLRVACWAAASAQGAENARGTGSFLKAALGGAARSALSVLSAPLAAAAPPPPAAQAREPAGDGPCQQAARGDLRFGGAGAAGAAAGAGGAAAGAGGQRRGGGGACSCR